MTEELLSPTLIHSAYLGGWFPMAEDDGTLAWYQPAMRALFPIEGIHVSRSLAREIRRGGFDIRYDTAFEQVVRNCRRPKENWINETIVASFAAVHNEGWAHSVEMWQDDQLVGGLYGIALGGCFSAESMFHIRTNASKIALWAAVEHCRELGFTVFDAQVMNPHLARLGAFDVPLDKYLELLHRAIMVRTEWSVGPFNQRSDGSVEGNGQEVRGAYSSPSS